MKRGNNVLVVMVVKANVDEFEDEVRKVFTIRLRKEFTGVVHVVSEKRRFLVKF